MAKKSEEIVYVAGIRKYAFSCKKRDEKGEFIPAVDGSNRRRYDEKGDLIFVETMIRFKTVVDSVKYGALCRYIVTPETPKYIAEALAKLAADRSSAVMLEDDYIKDKNPEQYDELKRRKDIENTLKTKDAEIAKLNEQIAALQAASTGKK